ncbi:MAG: 50S ribosomal protein L11 methyltransferase [Anaerolineales bacterium]|nr:50S ribosomal protein L11 methyltransferase [Anaerolineales bacterium]
MIYIFTFILILFIVIAALWILVPALYGLPPVTTRRERIRKALQMANLQSDEIFYDLGSGHGRVLVMAAKEFKAHAVGIEAGPVQCIIAWLNALYNGASSKVRVEAGDFYQADVSQADVVFAYLTSKQAPRLQTQLERQLKPGVRVVTVSFDFPNWKPSEVDREQLIFLYRMPQDY